MSEIGQLLKEARLKKNLTLDDLQHLTKIRKRYLEAVEEDNYKILPGTFYIKAFIKSYAEAVGLQPIELIKLYEQSNTIHPKDMPPTEQVRQNKLPSKNAERMNRWITNSVVFSFVFLIIVIVYFFSIRSYSGMDNSNITDRENIDSITNQSNQPKTTETPKQTTTPTPNTPTPTPIPKASVVFLKNENGVDLYEVNDATLLNLSFEIIGERCWIQVDMIDNQDKKILQKQQVYSRGDQDTFTITNSAYMNIGVASAVKININDTEISFGDYNNPKRIQFNLKKTD